MDSFELNKIAGAILGTLILVLGLGFLAELIYAPPELEAAAYKVAVAEEGHEAAAGEAAGEEAEEEAVPLGTLLAEADVDKGARVAKKCVACHNFEAGAPNKVGPNLHGVVGREIASVADFAYSDAMKQFGEENKTWSYQELFTYLEAPREVVPGTKMAFAGLKKPKDRADIISYLASISPDAPPPPEPPAQAAEAQPAAGAAQEGQAEGGSMPAKEETAPAGTDAQSDGGAPADGGQ